MSDDRKQNFDLCRKMIEQVIQALGLDPAKNRRELDDENRLCWKLRRGSAAVYIFLQASDDANYLQVVSPLMTVPEGKEVALFRRLLELNADALYGLAFGLRGNLVQLSSDRTTDELDPSEVKAMVSLVGRLGDHYDDKLVAEFGGTRKREAD
ncbi:MAG: hypothetical protein EXR72_11500 [Myxococcales bacterium]|nr:hypothetical protein [Myxococcales bacterium]